MAAGTLTIKVTVAWWVVPYARTVALFALLFGMCPDEEKVVRTVMRGIRCSL